MTHLINDISFLGLYATLMECTPSIARILHSFINDNFIISRQETKSQIVWAFSCV
jgi:hypothetical protein